MELAISNATKFFGKKSIFKDVSLTLKTGEIVAIFGRNGCGKSTLLKMIFGKMKGNSINILYNNEVIKPSEIIKEQIVSYLPQESFLPKNLKVRDIIPIYFSEEKKQDRIFYDPFIAKISNTVTGKLSLGELRYFEVLLIAQMDHQFMMLDEPFSMLEPIYKDKVKELLISLLDFKGIIITDHYYNDVFEISTNNKLMHDGKLYNIDTVNDLKDFGYLRK
ncbi:ATP-binding cassette domain-containing protein [Aequorivita echinoideorum]|uniref:ATP-binding cassette domain-containing protein n=1 Tax=Aequorivita echinoideorum TaxID=1549647 RepID=A0ABS5S6P6_9FLAO|nr:ATP-binding cassette domain-containing protein [Aequorivita echinoideorum]MBT0608872.1 ATP-binding cassette domain-containing protein [Aequorivita echinoideorum]